MNSEIFPIPPSNELIQKAVSELNSKGFFSIEGAITPDVLERFRTEVRNLVAEKGERYFSLINPYIESKSAFKPLGESDNFNGIMRSLAALGTTKDTSNSKLLNVLRVVTKTKSDERSLQFHYDATVITALIPILIPYTELRKSGHLIAVPNLRKIRSSLLINLFEKCFLQNRLAQKITGHLLLKNESERYVIKLIPGNIYFFWGYRTLHANLPIDPNALRATLIFHLGNPHEDSLIISAIARFRHLREKLNSK